MPIETIERDFKQKVCETLTLTSEGVDRYRVFTPFLFEDGDHLAIVLKRDQGRWILSDEGHTYMHLTYDLDEKDLQRGTRQKIITSALSAFSVNDRNGELTLGIQDSNYGDALYSFVQALLKISELSWRSEFQSRADASTGTMLVTILTASMWWIAESTGWRARSLSMPYPTTIRLEMPL
jgi:hypothetical protein